MSPKEDTTIQFSGLKPGRYDYSYTLNSEFFEQWENEEIRGGKVEISVEMERLAQMLMLSFTLKGHITTGCDRCLGDLQVPIEGQEQLCVRFSDSETSDDENVVVLPEKALEIDLGQWLYEYVAVRIPLQHTHTNGECDPEMTRYIVDEDMPHEKAADEVDPRWAALQNLK